MSVSPLVGTKNYRRTRVEAREGILASTTFSLTRAVNLSIASTREVAESSRRHFLINTSSVGRPRDEHALRRVPHTKTVSRFWWRSLRDLPSSVRFNGE